MITLKHIDKKYHPNKRNENHVLKDISITFPEKGMVMLLGKSGSGKTTLLNIIGGLDSAQKGEVQINDANLTSYNFKHWDEVRNRHIGYIFQNFYLMPNDTVYDNIKIALKMVGLTEEHEIEKRINEVLKLVGMPQYKFRKANQLSGGQQQRIAIARALAKDPDVIIADEPTGNLDSKNTMMIMNLLKEIAKEKLIIMVTHETRLAKHYGETIIEMEDGQITKTNQEGLKETIDTTSESDIYLHDLNHVSASNEQNPIDIYSDEETLSFKARLIVKNQSLYIEIPNHDFKHVHIVKPGDDLEIHEAARADMMKQETQKEQLSLSKLTIPHQRDKKSGVIPWKHSLQRALSSLKQSSKFAKLLYLGFAMSAAMFAVAISLFSNIYFFDDEAFLSEHKYTFDVTYASQPSLDTLLMHASEGPFDSYLLDRRSHTFIINLPRFYTTPSDASFESKIIPLEAIDESDLIEGSWPQSPHEVVISRQAALRMIEDNNFQRSGVNRLKDLVGLTYQSHGITFTITGITNHAASMVYGHLDHIYSLKTISPYTALSLLEADLEIKQGRNIETTNEVLTPYIENEAFIPSSIEVEGVSLEIVGTYEVADKQGDWMLMHLGALKEILHNTQAQNETHTYLFFTQSPRDAKTYLDAENLTYQDLYATERNQEVAHRVQSAGGLIIFTVVVMGLSALSMYFILRSSMMKRIYEIGVYRAIGVRRGDIMRIFTIEVLVITTLTSLLGYSFMRYILGYVDSVTAGIQETFNLSFIVFFTGVLLLYALNAFFGLMPLYRVLRKTPAQILTTYDL